MIMNICALAMIKLYKVYKHVHKCHACALPLGIPCNQPTLYCNTPRRRHHSHTCKFHTLSLLKGRKFRDHGGDKNKTHTDR